MQRDTGSEHFVDVRRRCRLKQVRRSAGCLGRKTGSSGGRHVRDYDYRGQHSPSTIGRCWQRKLLRRAFVGGGIAVLLGKRASAKTARLSALVLSRQDYDVLVRTIWGEARGECEVGEIAVAHVVFNRALREDRRVAAVCRARDQFSCWRHSSRLLRLSTRDSEYVRIKELVQQAVELYVSGCDFSRGATYYERHQDHARWARRHLLVARIGHHDFYRLRVGHDFPGYN